MHLVGSGEWHAGCCELRRGELCPVAACSSPVPNPPSQPGCKHSFTAVEATTLHSAGFPCLFPNSLLQPELVENGAGGQLTLTCDDYDQAAAALAIQQQQLADIEVRAAACCAGGGVAAAGACPGLLLPGHAPGCRCWCCRYARGPALSKIQTCRQSHRPACTEPHPSPVPGALLASRL